MKARVLYAEDDKGTRTLSTDFMCKKGYEVLAFKNGQEAFEAFLRERESGRTIDLVITDIQMPRMSGTQLIEKLRNERHFTGEMGIVSGTPVSEFFIKDNKIFYVGSNLVKCLSAYEQREQEIVK